MDLPENPTSESADAYVALIQQQLQRLSAELGEGQEIEAVVPLSKGGQIFATAFGYDNPDVIRITGIDADGSDVCLLAHKSTLQVVLRRVNSSGTKPRIRFQTPAPNQAGEIRLDETA